MILEDQIESQMMKVEYFLTNSIYLYFEETKVDLEKEENELFKKKNGRKRSSLFYLYLFQILLMQPKLKIAFLQQKIHPIFDKPVQLENHKHIKFLTIEKS